MNRLLSLLALIAVLAGSCTLRTLGSRAAVAETSGPNVSLVLSSGPSPAEPCRLDPNLIGAWYELGESTGVYGQRCGLVIDSIGFQYFDTIECLWGSPFRFYAVVATGTWCTRGSVLWVKAQWSNRTCERLSPGDSTAWPCPGFVDSYDTVWSELPYQNRGADTLGVTYVYPEPEYNRSFLESGSQRDGCRFYGRITIWYYRGEALY